MIVEFLNTSESLYKKDIPEHDLIVLEDLAKRYGCSTMLNTLNEVTYYGNDGSFNRTGGSRVRRFSGALQSIPSLLISASISWPATLIAALGAVSHRMRMNFEDKNSWLNRLNPMFWSDYLGTYHERESKSSKKSSSTNDNGKTWVDRAKTALVGTGAAGAGLLAGKAISDKDKEDASTAFSKDDIVRAAFVPYWVTLSNGEILRFRASSPEDAKIMANMVIAYTKKPCYDTMNYGIMNHGYTRYRFQFSDGEVCYWAAKTKKDAYEQALTTRVDLCSAMNQINPDVVTLDNLEDPEIVGKVEAVRNKPIPVPEQNKFLSVTTTKPEFKDVAKTSLPNPVYAYGTMYPYKVVYSNFLFNFPAPDNNIAADIARSIVNRNQVIEEVYGRMNRKLELYKVRMADGDVYVMSSDSENATGWLADKLYMSKVDSVGKILTGEEKGQYVDFLKEYGSIAKRIKSVSNFVDKDYTLKRGDKLKIYRVDGQDGKSEKVAELDV